MYLRNLKLDDHRKTCMLATMQIQVTPLRARLNFVASNKFRKPDDSHVTII